MIKWLLLFTCIFISMNSFASFNIGLACEEKKEQQMSLLANMSTSLTEANLAGQCTGYKSYSRIDIALSCSEFREQKRSLLSSLSTSLSEANRAGMCIGAIYRVAEECDADTSYINYSNIAENVYSLDSIKELMGCNRGYYGW